MKRAVSIILILFLALELTGCEAIQRKFTRKRKKEAIRPKFYQEGMSETRPRLELYIMHYAYWKMWHEDLVEKGGDNTKRDAMACDEIIGNLTDMRKHLMEEKAKELDIYIEQTKKFTSEIKSGTANLMRLGFIKQKLDNLRARIVRKFYYKKVREYIKLD